MKKEEAFMGGCGSPCFVSNTGVSWTMKQGPAGLQPWDPWWRIFSPVVAFEMWLWTVRLKTLGKPGYWAAPLTGAAPKIMGPG